MLKDFKLLSVSLQSGTLTRDEFISVVEACNKIIDDVETFNLQIIQEVLGGTSPYSRTWFAERCGFSVEDIPTYKIYNNEVRYLKNSLFNAIPLGFQIIHDKCLNNSQKSQKEF